MSRPSEAQWPGKEKFEKLLHSMKKASQSKVAEIAASALKESRFYKHVVHTIERYARKCKEAQRLPVLYVIDAICRQSKTKFGSKDPYTKRFEKNIISTAESVLHCSKKEKRSAHRIFHLWTSGNWFEPPILDALSDVIAKDIEATADEEADDGDEALRLAQANAAAAKSTSAQVEQRPPSPLLEAPTDTASGTQSLQAELFNDPTMSFDYGDSDDEEERVKEQERLLAKQKQQLQEASIREAEEAKRRKEDEAKRAQEAAMRAREERETKEREDKEAAKRRAEKEAYARANPKATSGPNSIAHKYASPGQRMGGAGLRYPGFVIAECQDNMPEDMLRVFSTVIWLGGLPPNLTEDHLRNTFQSFGRLVSVRVMPSSSFIYFMSRHSAEQAHRTVNSIDGNPVKMGWGRGQAVSKDNLDRRTGESQLPVAEIERLKAQGQPLFVEDISVDAIGYVASRKPPADAVRPPPAGHPKGFPMVTPTPQPTSEPYHRPQAPSHAPLSYGHNRPHANGNGDHPHNAQIEGNSGSPSRFGPSVGESPAPPAAASAPGASAPAAAAPAVHPDRLRIMDPSAAAAVGVGGVRFDGPRSSTAPNAMTGASSSDQRGAHPYSPPPAGRGWSPQGPPGPPGPAGPHGHPPHGPDYGQQRRPPPFGPPGDFSMRAGPAGRGGPPSPGYGRGRGHGFGGGVSSGGRGHSPRGQAGYASPAGPGHGGYGHADRGGPGPGPGPGGAGDAYRSGGFEARDSRKRPRSRSPARRPGGGRSHSRSRSRGRSRGHGDSRGRSRDNSRSRSRSRSGGRSRQARRLSPALQDGKDAFGRDLPPTEDSAAPATENDAMGLIASVLK